MQLERNAKKGLLGILVFTFFCKMLGWESDIKWNITEKNYQTQNLYVKLVSWYLKSIETYNTIIN